MEKYIISVEEIVLYEITADSKEEAEELFRGGEGDFIGYGNEGTEAIIKVEDLKVR